MSVRRSSAAAQRLTVGFGRAVGIARDTKEGGCVIDIMCISLDRT
ncbi:hypothetical protein PTKU64_88250 [Paraburkholderia terrae]|uniref:Uncharacterized protein n=1 Tax=Paraburkholderia terrae TaxID=311230 RepID=A0ABM7U1C2_9BURK|nr:hypothetical protein PTKU64_88250 [Paraburkholderia terrae]